MKLVTFIVPTKPLQNLVHNQDRIGDMVADERIKKKKIETLVEVTLTQKMSVMARWVFLQLAKKILI